MKQRVRLAPRAFSMIEVLVALVVFSLGLLAMVSIQATAVRLSSDARYRATATFLADQLLARMLIANRADLAQFAHYSSGTTTCAPTGAPSAHALVTGWLVEVNAQLPNAAASTQQIVVDTGNNTVTVRLCWQAPNDTPKSLVVTNQVQWPAP